MEQRFREIMEKRGMKPMDLWAFRMWTVRGQLKHVFGLHTMVPR